MPLQHHLGGDAGAEQAVKAGKYVISTDYKLAAGLPSIDAVIDDSTVVERPHREAIARARERRRP